MSLTFTTAMFNAFMAYYDNPTLGFRSDLAPTGLFLGFAGAIAAFVLPAMGSLEAAKQSLEQIQLSFSSTVDLISSFTPTNIKDYNDNTKRFIGNYLF